MMMYGCAFSFRLVVHHLAHHHSPSTFSFINFSRNEFFLPGFGRSPRPIRFYDVGSSNISVNLSGFVGDILDDIDNSEISDISDVTWYTLVISYLIAISFGLSGNTLIIWAVLSNRRMRTARNVFYIDARYFGYSAVFVHYALQITRSNLILDYNEK